MDLEAQIEAARARVQAQVDAAAQRRSAMGSISDDLRTLTASVTSANGVVTVEAGVDGRIVAVRFASVTGTPTALGVLVTETIAQAQAAARTAAADLAAERLGADSPIARDLRPVGE